MKSNTISVYRISTPSLYLHSGRILYGLNVYSIHVLAAYSLYKLRILTLCTCSVYLLCILALHIGYTLPILAYTCRPQIYSSVYLLLSPIYSLYTSGYLCIPQDTSVYLPSLEVYILPMYNLVSSSVPAAVFRDPPHAAGQGTTPIF